MDTELLKIVGQIAGIGGIAFGVLLLLFRDVIRKAIFPKLTKEQGYKIIVLFLILVWSVALFGIIAWLISIKSNDKDKEINRSIKRTQEVSENLKQEENGKESFQEYLNDKIKDSELRIALVVGNNDYKKSPLKNPANDAMDISTKLTDKGFKIIKKINPSTNELINSIKDFNKFLCLGGVGLFYYSGHGVQLKGQNYIIPVDADIETMDDVIHKSINLNRLLAPVDKIIEDSPKRSGDVIIYSTGSGNVAFDGPGRNSIFTKHFSYAIDKNEFELFDILRYLCREVSKETNGKQIPWLSASLDTEFYCPNC